MAGGDLLPQAERVDRAALEGSVAMVDSGCELDTGIKYED